MKGGAGETRQLNKKKEQYGEYKLNGDWFRETTRYLLDPRPTNGFLEGMNKGLHIGNEISIQKDSIF